MRFGAAVLAACLMCASAASSAYTTLYAFGDSLSDDGNASFLNGSYRSPAYCSPNFWDSLGCRGSNGKTWVEDLSAKLVANGKLSPGTLKPSYRYPYYGFDFAVGGAQTGTTAGEGVRSTDLPGQIAQFEVWTHFRPAAGALCTLDIGTNDVANALSRFVANPTLANTIVVQAEKNTVNQIKLLYALGARNLLFYDVPDLKFIPAYYENRQLRDVAEFYSGWFDQQVRSDLNNVGLHVFYVDTFDLLKDGNGNPAFFTSFGNALGKPFNDTFTFTDVTDPCLTGSSPCSATVTSQNRYLFWDVVHPTASGHLLTADYAYCTLASNCPVHRLTAALALGGAPTAPEPSTWAMMLLGVVGLGFAGWHVRRKGRRGRSRRASQRFRQPVNRRSAAA